MPKQAKSLRPYRRSDITQVHPKTSLWKLLLPFRVRAPANLYNVWSPVELSTCGPAEGVESFEGTKSPWLCELISGIYTSWTQLVESSEREFTYIRGTQYLDGEYDGEFRKRILPKTRHALHNKFRVLKLCVLTFKQIIGPNQRQRRIVRELLEVFRLRLLYFEKEC